MPYKNIEDKQKHNKEYYEKNKEKLKEYNNEYQKQYKKNNKEKISEYQKEYMKEYNKEYYLNNKEKFKQYQEDNKEYIKEYRKTDKGLKINRLSCWKSRGLISEDYDKIYERFILTEECDNCGIELNQDFNTKKCMDHSHTTGQFRNILCNLCNVNRID